MPLPRLVDNTRHGHCVCWSGSETSGGVSAVHIDNSSSHLQATDSFGLENQDSLHIEAEGVAEVAALSYKSCLVSQLLATREVLDRFHRDGRWGL